MLRHLSALAQAGEAQAIAKGFLPVISAAWQQQQLAFVSTSQSDSAAQAAPAATPGTKPPLMKDFQVYRWDPDTPDAKPKYVSYKVDINRCVLIGCKHQPGTSIPLLLWCAPPCSGWLGQASHAGTHLCCCSHAHAWASAVSCSCGPMMLDVLFKIKDEQDQTLSFRRSCRWVDAQRLSSFYYVQ